MFCLAAMQHGKGNTPATHPQSMEGNSSTLTYGATSLWDHRCPCNDYKGFKYTLPVPAYYQCRHNVASSCPLPSSFD